MADDPSVLAGTASARFALEQSMKSLSELILAFEELTERLGDPEGQISPSEVSKARVAFAHVRSQLVEEVGKHEKRVLESKGLVANAPIDFDALRASIGSKLGRIRDARDAE